VDVPIHILYRVVNYLMRVVARQPIV
jgi:hypothetical protein